MTHAEIKALVEPESPLMKIAFKAAPMETKTQRAEARKAMREAATALRSFMDGGWRLVPVEPTEAMIEAAHTATPVTFLMDADPRNIWSAMLRASPLPTPPAVEGE